MPAPPCYQLRQVNEGQFSTLTQRLLLTVLQNTILPVMRAPHSPFLHYRLVPSLEIINTGNTGNQNHPDLEVRVVLVTCFSNIDF